MPRLTNAVRVDRHALGASQADNGLGRREHDLLLGQGQTTGLGLLAAARRAQSAKPLGTRRTAGQGRDDSPGSLDATVTSQGTVCSIARSTIARRQGCDPPARICWSLPGRHSVAECA